jgi:hypothetical protein
MEKVVWYFKVGGYISYEDTSQDKLLYCVKFVPKNCISVLEITA